MTQIELLKSYAARRDPEAFAQIVEQYQRFIFAICRRRMHRQADVEDAVQEVFLRLTQQAGKLNSNIGGWLHRCATNISIDMNRRSQTQSMHESTAAHAPSFNIENRRQQLVELREQVDVALER